MSNKLYFAYGSNLLKEQMSLRCPKSKPLMEAVLLNYELIFKSNKHGRGVADVVSKIGGRVHGALYEITASDMRNLDRFEGHPNVYVRQTIKINTVEGEKESIIYIMRPDFTFKYPNQDYLDKIIKGYEDWGFPSNYVLQQAQLCRKREATPL